MDRILTLHFVDGTKLAFDFPEQSANPAARQLKLADFMTSQHLVIEAEGNVMMFPVANIKYIALSLPMLNVKGGPSGLPPHAIVGARVRV
ncbi:MAG: hypothetical protein ACXWHB_09525 [Usitatibacter sp.]